MVRVRSTSVVLLVLALSLWGGSAAVAAPPPPSLGPNVTIFDPSMPVAQIQSTIDAIYARQVDDEMGSNRYALLFKPGVYGSAGQPLHVKVGYYTEVAGLALRRATSRSTARSRCSTAAWTTAARATALRSSTSGARCPT
jgi:hypothetical protein